MRMRMSMSISISISARVVVGGGRYGQVLDLVEFGVKLFRVVSQRF